MKNNKVYQLNQFKELIQLNYMCAYIKLIQFNLCPVYVNIIDKIG